MEVSVELPVETPATGSNGGTPAPALEMRLLGPLTIHRAGQLLPLPASRKARALIGYLVLQSRSASRTQLCELLWDLPNDPRGELRWCLSKIRQVLDSDARKRVETVDDGVKLDLSDCFVDVNAFDHPQRHRETTAAPDATALRAQATLFAGDFLEGLDVARSPRFDGWLLAQRRHWRARHVVLLEQLVERLEVGGEESCGYLAQWLGIAPFDLRAHERLLSGLARCGRWDDGEEHLSATAKTFEANGLDWRTLGQAWRAERTRRCDNTQSAPGGSVVTATDASFRDTGEQAPAAATSRASVAITPFAEQTAPTEPRGGLAHGFTHDLITRLAKLHTLFVIAQGTMFALQERKIGAQEAARTLNVDYVVSGSMQRRANRLEVQVELSEVRTSRVLWAERFERALDDAFAVLHEIGDGIVAAVASEIEAVERNRAILKSPNSLDAWEAHHRGLWHMYRFNQTDNDKARQCFELAVRLDPGFSRAFAGLSFTHWQDAFQGWGERDHAVRRAFEVAGQSLLADERDPAAHWAMGRAMWLRGQQAQSLIELEAAVDLSPSFALGHYTLAFVHCQSGNPHQALEAADHSRHLSPFDPLLFGMLGARALALVRLGDFEAAADWAVKAASRPNAHVHILAIAAHCLALAGRQRDALDWVAVILRKAPGYRLDDFLSAFRFTGNAQALYRRAAKQIGIV